MHRYASIITIFFAYAGVGCIPQGGKVEKKKVSHASHTSGHDDETGSEEANKNSGQALPDCKTQLALHEGDVHEEEEHAGEEDAGEDLADHDHANEESSGEGQESKSPGGTTESTDKSPCVEPKKTKDADTGNKSEDDHDHDHEAGEEHDHDH